MNNELVALGQEIRRLRQNHKMSQEELAFRSGLHRTYLSDVERGARNLTFASLLAIARGLGLTMSELTRSVGSPVRRHLAGKRLAATDPRQKLGFPVVRAGARYRKEGMKLRPHRQP